MALRAGLGPAVREAQAAPAEAITPRASRACSSGSAGRPGKASDKMCGARGAPAIVGWASGTTAATAASAVGFQAVPQARHRWSAPASSACRASVAAPAEADQRREVLGAAAQAAFLAAARPRAGAARAPGRTHRAPAPRGP